MKEITEEKLRELIKGGYTKYQAAEYFQCDPLKIDRFRERHKVPGRFKQKKYRDTLDGDKIKLLYIEQKRTAKEVSEILQITTCTFRKKLKELGIKQRSRADTSHLLNFKNIKVTDHELIELYKTNTVDQLVDYLRLNRLGDISSTTLSKRLKEIEVKTGTKFIRPNICRKK